MISDNRLRWLSGPDYIRSEPGQVAAELLAARGTIAALEARCQQADAILAIVKRHAEDAMADDDVELDGDAQVMMMAIARYYRDYPPETNRDPTPEHLLKQGYRSGKATDPTSQETKANPPGCICRYEHKSDPMCQYEPETMAKPVQFMDVNAAARALFRCEKCGQPMICGPKQWEYACDCNTPKIKGDER